jgi:peroxiredoxin
MCSDLIEAYREQKDQLPSELSVFGICPEFPDIAGLYANERNIPFPLYCDTARICQSEYGIIAFPSLMALDKEGVIRYINFGMMEEFALEDILRELVRF